MEALSFLVTSNSACISFVTQGYRYYGRFRPCFLPELRYIFQKKYIFPFDISDIFFLKFFP